MRPQPTSMPSGTCITAHPAFCSAEGVLSALLVPRLQLVGGVPAYGRIRKHVSHGRMLQGHMGRDALLAPALEL